MFRFGHFLRTQMPRAVIVATTTTVTGSILYGGYQLYQYNDNQPFAGSNFSFASCEPAATAVATKMDVATNTSRSGASVQPVSPYVPNLEEYEAINEQTYIKDFNVSLTNHVLYSCLLDDRRIKRYEVYKHKHHEEIYCIVDFGEEVVGWPTIVHGGISALLIDNTFGWLLFAYNKPMSVTANLHLDYRHPVRSNSTSILRVKIDHTDGRKLHMTGSLTEAHTGRVQVEAKSLFIMATKKTKQEGY